MTAERTVFQSIPKKHVLSLGPQHNVWEAACAMTRANCGSVLIMIERGFRHLPVVGPDRKILGVFSVRDALPREIGTALNQAEFNEQVNDALG